MSNHFLHKFLDHISLCIGANLRAEKQQWDQLMLREFAKKLDSDLLIKKNKPDPDFDLSIQAGAEQQDQLARHANDNPVLAASKHALAQTGANLNQDTGAFLSSIPWSDQSDSTTSEPTAETPESKQTAEDTEARRFFSEMPWDGEESKEFDDPYDDPNQHEDSAIVDVDSFLKKIPWDGENGESDEAKGEQ